jgi:hypothetical protein
LEDSIIVSFSFHNFKGYEQVFSFYFHFLISLGKFPAACSGTPASACTGVHTPLIYELQKLMNSSEMSNSDS